MRRLLFCVVVALLLFALVSNATSTQKASEANEKAVRKLLRVVKRLRGEYIVAALRIAASQKKIDLAKAEWESVRQAIRRAKKFLGKVQEEQLTLEAQLREKKGELVILKMNHTRTSPADLAEKQTLRKAIGQLKLEMQYITPKLDGARQRVMDLKARLAQTIAVVKKSQRKHAKVLTASQPSADGFSKALQDYLAALRANIRWRRIKNVPFRKRVLKLREKVKRQLHQQRRLERKSKDAQLVKTHGEKLKKFQDRLHQAEENDKKLSQIVQDRMTEYVAIKKELIRLFKRHGWNLPAMPRKDELDERKGESDEDDEEEEDDEADNDEADEDDAEEEDD